MASKKQCLWILDRGYWKGKRCGNPLAPGSLYCVTHLGMAQNEARLAKQAPLLAAHRRRVRHLRAEK